MSFVEITQADKLQAGLHLAAVHLRSFARIDAPAEVYLRPYQRPDNAIGRV